MGRIVALLMGIIVIGSLSGCMMAGGMGGMAGMSSPDQSAAASRQTVIGAARNSDVQVTLEFPAVTAGNDARITVRVQDTARGQPISRAIVTVLIQGGDGGEPDPDRIQAIESAPGVYEATYRFTAAGVHTATTEVLPGEEADALSVSVRQDVAAATHQAGRRSRLLPIAFVGTAAMAAMMVVMIVL